MFHYYETKRLLHIYKKDTKSNVDTESNVSFLNKNIVLVSCTSMLLNFYARHVGLSLN